MVKIKDYSILKKNIYVIFYFLSFVINLLLYLAIFSNIIHNGIEYYFNSDTLYFPTLFNDIFKNGYSLKGWHIPGAPNFLPDMLLYFIIMLFVNHPIYASFIYGIVQYLLFLLIINWIINILSNSKNYLINSLINLSISLFFLIYLVSNDFLITFHIISNTYHFGAFLFTLLSFAFVLKFLKTERKIFLYSFFLTSTLAVFNDKLYIFLCNLPLLFLIIFIKSDKKYSTTRLLLANISSVISGLIIFRVFKLTYLVHIANTDNLIDLSRSKHSFNQFFGLLKSFYETNFFNKLFTLIIFLSFLLILVYVTKKFFNFFFKKHLFQNYNSIRFLYFLFFFISSLSILFAPLISGIYLDNSCIRYNIFSFYILVINFFPVIYFWNKKLENSRIIDILFSFVFIITLTIYVMIFIKKFDRDNFKEYFNYYPECAKCIDNYIEKEKNIYGIATYWIGKVALNFSKKGARIYTVYEDSMYPWPHVGNKNWYSDNKGKYSNPVFTFLIVPKSQNLNVIKKNLGEPLKIDTCSNYLIMKFSPFKFNSNLEPYFIDYKKNASNVLFEDFEGDLIKYEKSIDITDRVSFSGKYSNVLDKNREYSYTHIIRVDELKKMNVRKVVFSAKLYFDSYCETALVISIEKGNQNLLWKSLQIKKEEYKLKEWKEFILTIEIPEDIDKFAIFKAFVWNINKCQIFVDDLKLYKL